MSQYVSRTLAGRRAADRRNALGLRVATAFVLLVGAFVCGALCYWMLGNVDEIAAYTRDSRATIGQVGIFLGIASFGSFILSTFVAASIYDRG